MSDEFVKEVSLAERDRGLRISEVLPDCSARARIFENDVIVAMMPNHEAIKNEADLKRVLGSKKAGDVVSFQVIRPTLGANNVVLKQTVVVNLRIAGN